MARATLADFQAVGQPRTVMFAFVINEHLRFVFQASECIAMDDAVAVALEF